MGGRIDDDRRVLEDPAVPAGVRGEGRQVRTLPEPVEHDITDIFAGQDACGLAASWVQQYLL
jgi:hypothetical protein